MIFVTQSIVWEVFIGKSHALTITFVGRMCHTSGEMLASLLFNLHLPKELKGS